MPTILHISASGLSWWKKTGTTWVATPEPTQGYVGVVTDVAEETFVEINVPRVFGADRKNYVQRQLATRFADSVFRTALPPKSEGGLMSRLAPPQQTLAAIDPGERIQGALQGLQVSIAGVWSASLLLAQLGKKAAMPTNLFIVLCQPSGMRILFLKQHAPVLTRLIAATQTVPEQAAEIVRTLRHLENTRVIERQSQRFSVLLLGGAPGLASALAAERLDAVPPPAPWNQGTAADWNHVLFDLATKNPPSQLAPLSYRSSYLARKLVQASKVCAVLCAAVAVWAASGSITAAMQAQAQRTAVQAAAQSAAAQVAKADQAIEAYGVSPELVRKAVAIDLEEIATAPSLEDGMVRLAKVIGAIPDARLKTMQWQVLPAGEAACANATPVPDPAQGATPDAPPARTVELQFAVVFSPANGPRLLAQQATEISRQLGLVKGAKVLRDPALLLRQGDINTGTQAMAAPDLQWCVTLPGTAPAGATTAGATQPRAAPQGAMAGSTPSMVGASTP